MTALEKHHRPLLQHPQMNLIWYVRSSLRLREMLYRLYTVAAESQPVAIFEPNWFIRGSIVLLRGVGVCWCWAESGAEFVHRGEETKGTEE